MTAEVAPSPTVPRRRRRHAAWIAAAVGSLFGVLIVVLATRPTALSRIADSPLVGRQAPAITGATIDGERYDSTDDRGRWVLVNFFATWCVPCRKEHPDLVRFAARHLAVGDAVVVAVVYDDEADAVRRFRDGEGGDWPMVVDPGGRIALSYGVRGIPESFLVDPRGTVAVRLVGGVTADRLDAVLARARQGGP